MDKDDEQRQLSSAKLMAKVDLYWREQYNIDMLRDALERVSSKKSIDPLY
jgi:hypothetical protein